jgi:superfamily II DNA/RNA helicase
VTIGGTLGLQRMAGRGGRAGRSGAATTGVDPMAQLRTQEDPPVAELTQEFQQESQQLQTMENDQTSSAAQLEAKLTEYRAVHKKIDDALALALKDLQSVVTLRQESLLLLADYLN